LQGTQFGKHIICRTNSVKAQYNKIAHDLNSLPDKRHDTTRSTLTVFYAVVVTRMALRYKTRKTILQEILAFGAFKFMP
jgi:hypothetical protein